VEEADIVSAQYAREEGGDVRFADGFLLVRLEHLDGDGVDEGRFAAVDFPCLVEEVLQRRVGLAFFVIGVVHDFLDLREAGLCDGVDELGGLGVASIRRWS